VVCNFTQVIRENYRIGIPRKGLKKFLIVMQKYGGSAVKNSAKLAIEASPYDGRDYSIELTLAPLAVSVFKMV
jgi:1,4-alpha-glucan branching enzyme